MKILLTGGSGFIGRNILPILAVEHQITAPTRSELDLSDSSSVGHYLSTCKADILVNCAVADPAKPNDRGKNVYQDTTDIFKRLSAHAFSRIINIGSGAEYDKSRNIVEATEDNIGDIIPSDDYGRAKFDINSLIRKSDNAINVRIFGCYGPGEPERRFIRHAISCCLSCEPITIRRDCRFSYVYVNDLGAAILKLLEIKQTNRRDYNLCGGRPLLLSDIATIVKSALTSDVPVTIKESGFANEYSGSDLAFQREFPNFKFTPIEHGIAAEADWLRNNTL